MTTPDEIQPGRDREPCDLGHYSEIGQLPDATLKALRDIGRVRRCSAGQIVVEAGSASDIVGCVQSGFLRMQKTLPDGRYHIVGLLVDGDMFGRVHDGPPALSIEAATDAVVCIFPRAPFEALLARSPELDRLVLTNVLNELDRAREWMVILSTPRVRGRLAGFLLLLCARYTRADRLLGVGPGMVEVAIPIDRTDIAHLLGTRPESISRAFHALADAGCIEILRPDLVVIRDLDALAAEAGEERAEDIPGLEDLLGILAVPPR